MRLPDSIHVRAFGSLDRKDFWPRNILCRTPNGQSAIAPPNGQFAIALITVHRTLKLWQGNANYIDAGSLLAPEINRFIQQTSDHLEKQNISQIEAELLLDCLYLYLEEAMSCSK